VHVRVYVYVEIWVKHYFDLISCWRTRTRIYEKKTNSKEVKILNIYIRSSILTKKMKNSKNFGTQLAGKKMRSSYSSDVYAHNIGISKYSCPGLIQGFAECAVYIELRCRAESHPKKFWQTCDNCKIYYVLLQKWRNFCIPVFRVALYWYIGWFFELQFPDDGNSYIMLTDKRQNWK
jgi:hypothetical protein